MTHRAAATLISAAAALATLAPGSPVAAASPPPLSGYAVLALGDFGGARYAGTDAGLFVSRAGGSWTVASGALSTARVNALAVVPGLLVAATDSGVLSSRDGVAWNPAGLAGLRVDSLASAGGSVVAGTGTGSGTDGLAFRSDDGGRSWNPAATVPALEGLPGPAVQAMLAPTPGIAALAGTAGSGVYRSVNGAGGWTATGAGPGWVTSLLRRGGTSVLAATDDGLFSSGDSGASWSTATFPQQDPWVQALGGDASAPLAGTYDGDVFRGNGSGGWTQLASGLPSVLALLPAPRGGGVITGTFDGLYCIGCSAGTVGSTVAGAGGATSAGGAHRGTAPATAPPTDQRPGAPGATAPPFARGSGPTAIRSLPGPAAAAAPTGGGGRPAAVWALAGGLVAVSLALFGIGRRRSQRRA
jgi:hypothetical protein